MRFISENWLENRAAQSVLRALEVRGHQGYFVGGCVRNALLGLPVTDLDISTSARPDTVMSIAKELGFKAIPTGIEHGTVTVIGDGEPLEITTFRKDVETDGRHAVIAFADTLEEDAARRDFRMNALYADVRGALIDPVGGLPDIEARKLVFVGEAEARIKEDYLRIIRLFRFAAQLGFGVAGMDTTALSAASSLAAGLSRVSIERKTTEIMKLLSADDPADVVEAMDRAGVLRQILPVYDLPTFKTFIAHEARTLPLGRLAALTCGSVELPLRLSKKEAALVEKARRLPEEEPSFVAIAYREGAVQAELALRVAAAMRGVAPDQDRLARLESAEQQIFPVSAKDLLPKLQGKALGDALKALETDWIESGFKLTKQALLARLNKER